jgi:hypothetical protein
MRLALFALFLKFGLTAAVATPAPAGEDKGRIGSSSRAAGSSTRAPTRT